jgi:hypothetical protein
MNLLNQNNIDINTDELEYVVNNVNDCNANLYREIYSISVIVGDSFLDNRIVALMSVSSRYEASFIAIHINTIFLEFLRDKLHNKGILIDTDCTLPELFRLYSVIDEIEKSDELVSCLQEAPMIDMDLFTLSNMLGVDIFDSIPIIASSDGFIRYLYDNNKEAVYREYSEPLSVPDVL